MFLMLILKLCLNLFDEDIGYRFEIHASTMSRKFNRVLDVTVVRTAHLIKWPEREVLRLTMPMSFRKIFKQCCVIIDCSEIFIERPSDLLACAQVWSNYKHHSTIKFLIGITPQGTISYVLNCVGRRMSDKEIAEQSSLLQYLLPGKYIDIICWVFVTKYFCVCRRYHLADKGFTCDEYARMAMAEIKTTPLLRQEAVGKSKR